MAVLRFLACCDLKMIYAACLILCAAGSLFTSNSADSANVFAESNITLSNGVLPMISIIQYPYINGGKPNYTISQFSLNSKEGGGGMYLQRTLRSRLRPRVQGRLGAGGRPRHDHRQLRRRQAPQSRAEVRGRAAEIRARVGCEVAVAGH